MSLILGLTGSIGMGKSTVAALFRAGGVPVFDADAEVHRLQGPGGALVGAIEARFPGTTGPDGVDRQRLGARVFADPRERAALERLVHPAIRAARRAFLRRYRAHRLVVLDIPLLFETGGWRQVDRIAVVTAPAWRQRQRVLARPGMTMARLKAIQRLQMSDAGKRARADHIIDNGGNPAATRRQIRHLIACLRARAGRY